MKNAPLKWIGLIVIIVVLVVVLAGVKACQFKAMGEGAAKQAASARSTVSAQKVGYEQWADTTDAVGTLRAVRSVNIAPEVGGIVTAVNVHSGQDVRAGQVIVDLLSDTDEAQLASLQASAALARTNAARSEELYKNDVGSKAQADNDAAQVRVYEAQLRQQGALIAKKTIRAPFDGQMGIVTITKGTYLNAGSSGAGGGAAAAAGATTPAGTGGSIGTLQQLDPMLIDFAVPQQQLAIVGPGASARFTTDAAPGKEFGVVVTAIDTQIDPSTRNIRVEGKLANPGHKLLPGMFGKVVLGSGPGQKYLTLPQTAVTFNPYGETVFVAIPQEQYKPPADSQPAADAKDAKAKQKDADNKPKYPAGTLLAQQVFVTTGPQRGDQVAIVKGLKEGDTVITSGQIKLKNGAPVIIDNRVQPSSDPAPMVPNN